MTDRPILFSGPMIRALLEGRKTQTRRVFKGIEADGNGTFHVFNRHGGLIGVSEADVPTEAPDYVPYAVGDRLWVRETWKPIPKFRPGGYFVPGTPFYGLDTFYRADGNCPLWANGPWKPSIFMPHSASRLTLIVTDVRVQRLQEITYADVEAEGVMPPSGEAFSNLWDNLNASRGFGWDADPWVVALTFNVIKENIDQFEGGAHG